MSLIVTLEQLSPVKLCVCIWGSLFCWLMWAQRSSRWSKGRRQALRCFSITLCVYVCVCARMCGEFMCVFNGRRQELGTVSPACLGVSQLGSVALWQPTSVLQDPTLPSPPSLLVCKRSIAWNIDAECCSGTDSLLHRPRAEGPTVGFRSRGAPPWPLPAACSPVVLVMSLWDTYTWLLVSAVAMRTITRCAIYGNPWGRQEGCREWERFSATLQLVSCSKTLCI